MSAKHKHDPKHNTNGNTEIKAPIDILKKMSITGNSNNYVNTTKSTKV